MLPISDILIRSISGYVFIIPVLMLYFLYLKKRSDYSDLRGFANGDHLVLI